MQSLKLTAIIAMSSLLVTISHAAPIPVTTMPLSSLLRPQQYNVPASVKPFNQPQLAAEVTGQIIRLPVRVGTVVKKGQILAELDCRNYQARKAAASAALSRSQSQLKLAKNQLDRANNLKRKSSISEELLDQRRTELKTAQADQRSQQAQVEQAKLDVPRCIVRAPFDALVIQRMSSEGSLANPGTPLVELVQLEQLEVSAKLQENEAETLAKNTKAFFSYQDKHYPLILRTISPYVNERSRTQEARLIFKANNAPIGAAGRLNWFSTEKQLPANYLVRRNAQLGIFVARNNKASFIHLPNAREGQAATVNIDDSELLVTQGRQRLQEGDEINITESAR